MDNPGILVVDDDREIVKAISINLENEGYRVYKAYDGLQALDILATHSIQLILLDIMMPRLDGLSATMKIREERNIPIIILSAKSEHSDKILVCPWEPTTMSPSRSTLWSLWQGSRLNCADL